MEAQPAFTDTLLPSEEGDVLELDELWSFVGSKTQTLWLWVALCRRTRQIVAWTRDGLGLSVDGGTDTAWFIELHQN